MTKLHARLSASGSHRWLYCPGSIEAEKNLPRTSSTFAQEGTCAHELAEICLLTGESAFDWEGKTLIENNAFTVPREMCADIQEYLDYCRAIPSAHYLVEQEVWFDEWVEQGFGTCDFIAIDAKNEHVHIVDLKYGKGREVYAKDNSQGILYALGFLNDFGNIYPFTKISLHIHQPRRDHIDVWEIGIDDLLKWGEFIRERAEEAKKPNAERVAGEKQCMWCGAKAQCPALLKLTEKTILCDFDNLDTDTITQIETLTEEQIGLALKNQKLIASWFDAIESHIMRKLSSGESVTGYKLVEGRSNRQWRNEDDAAVVLSAQFEEDKLFTRKFISPPQAEKLLGKKNISIIADMIEKPQGKPTLATIDDPRPQIQATAKIEDFEDLEDEF